MKQRMPVAVANKRAVRVMVVEALPLLRRELVATLTKQPGVAVVADAADLADARARAPSAMPDVVLVSTRLLDMRSLHAIRALRAAWPAVEVLMLTASEDAAAVAAGLRAGATGYMGRGLDGELVAHTLRRASKNSNEGSADAPPCDSFEPTSAPLSPREREILRLIAEGWSNKEIARELVVAESTVKIHVQHILRKLKLGSRVQAAVYAAENGLALRR